MTMSPTEELFLIYQALGEHGIKAIVRRTHAGIVGFNLCREPAEEAGPGVVSNFDRLAGTGARNNTRDFSETAPFLRG